MGVQTIESSDCHYHRTNVTSYRSAAANPDLSIMSNERQFCLLHRPLEQPQHAWQTPLERFLA